MEADPGQQDDVAGRHADVVQKMRSAYEAWFQDVTHGLERLPIPVGHGERPEVELPAPEADLQGGLSFKGGAGWANDWIVNWVAPGASASWDLAAAREGRYSVTLLYCCPAGDVGARVRVEAGTESCEAVLTRAHDPQPLPSPDRVPRGEVYERVWARLEVGTLRLPAGRTRLTVRAPVIPGRTAMELKAVRLRRPDG